MSDVVFPSRFHDLHDNGVPWVVGWAVVVDGDIYLKIAKVWHIDRDDGRGCEFIDFISESTVEYLGRDPEALRAAWNSRFRDEQFHGELLPPCDFLDEPPTPHSRHRRTVKRDWINMTETLVYEGAA